MFCSLNTLDSLTRKHIITLPVGSQLEPNWTGNGWALSELTVVQVEVNILGSNHSWRDSLRLVTELWTHQEADTRFIVWVDNLGSQKGRKNIDQNSCKHLEQTACFLRLKLWVSNNKNCLNTWSPVWTPNCYVLPITFAFYCKILPYLLSRQTLKVSVEGRLTSRTSLFPLFFIYLFIYGMQGLFSLYFLISRICQM